ncbi:MAG: hypothetical protein QOF02_2250 [Blastocatellia bacterium]|jgi:hypothetical protein|nr:hypothetical protein [Blastocatellia bacterium]
MNALPHITFADPNDGSAHSNAIQDLLGRKFRFNPAYRFSSFDQLTEEDRRLLGTIDGDPEICGILVPSAPGLSVKAVCRNTALLLESLRSPGFLSTETQKEFSQGNSTLLRLVLDSVLEVQLGDAFVSGASAAKIMGPCALEKNDESRPARLSLEALQYGQALECGHAPMLSARLYFYNRMPASPRWTRRINTRREFADYLGLEAEGVNQRLLNREWMLLNASPDNPGWLSWRSRRHPRVRSPYKLYLSPQCEDLRETLRIVLPILTELDLPAFKLARDLYGILRPDKFVIYVPTLEQLEVTSDTLLSNLNGVRAHGVPFTANIDAEGLVSWGMDPPKCERLSSWQGTSWRRWVTDRLAVALLAAKESPPNAELEPWQFALQRVNIEGVNISTWTPANVEWAGTKR